MTYIFFQTSSHELESLDSDIHMQVNSCEWNENYSVTPLKERSVCTCESLVFEPGRRGRLNFLWEPMAAGRAGQRTWLPPC